MKIKSLIIFLLTIIMIFPISINASECKNDDIKIKKVELSSHTGNAENISFNGDNDYVNLKTKMNVIGDSLTYKIIVKNTSNNDYLFDKNQILKDYISYSISYDDSSNIIKSGEEKTIYLRLDYNNKPQIDNLQNDIFIDDGVVSFDLVKKSNGLINPETGNKIIFISLLFCFLIVILIIFVKKNNKIIAIIIILSLLITPQIVNALCTCSLKIHLDLEIDVKEAKFISGIGVNVRMKRLAGDDTSTYTFQDSNIVAIKQSDIEPNDSNKEEKNVVSMIDSPYPIYMWYDNGIIYWWSEDKTPSVNSSGEFMFWEMNNLSNIEGVSTFDFSNTPTLYGFFGKCNLNNLDSLSSWNLSNVKTLIYTFIENEDLTSIDGISNWNVSDVTNISGLFDSCQNLENIEPLSNWDTSNIKNMSQVFHKTKIKNLESLENWDTSNVSSMRALFDTCSIVSTKGLENWNVTNVTDMVNIFARNYDLTDLSGLKDWDTSSLTDLGQGFLSCSLEDLSPLRNWNVSNVTNMYSLFNNNKKLQDLTPLSNWNVSNVTTLYRTFRNCDTLQVLSGLENWDVSKVENFAQLFYKDFELEDISALENWNTSSGKDMSSMFYDVKNITNVTKINDWDVKNVTSFSHMFRYATTFPTFNKRPGEWVSGGTYIPNE